MESLTYLTNLSISMVEELNELRFATRISLNDAWQPGYRKAKTYLLQFGGHGKLMINGGALPLGLFMMERSKGASY